MAKVCVRNLEVQVLSSGAGYYIGTMCSDDGFPEPHCRISVDYFKTKQLAQDALDSVNFRKRDYAAENQFCNGEHGCRIKEEDK